MKPIRKIKGDDEKKPMGNSNAVEIWNPKSSETKANIRKSIMY